MATFNLIGSYRITPDKVSLAIAARYHRYNWLVNGDNEFIGDLDPNIFKDLGLLEFLVSGNFSSKELLNISHNDQSPYLEYYLNEAGTDAIDEKKAVANGIFRICFFIHFVDVTQPLYINGQKIKLPEMDQLPDRLLPFTHYVPVD